MTTTWKNGMTGDFNVATNWTNGVPTAGSTALITAPGTYTVTSSQNNTLSALDLASGGTLDISASTFALTLGSGAGALDGVIDIGAATLALGTSLGASTMNNAGTMNVNFTLSVNGEVTLVGDGTIKLAGDIEGGTSPATLINSSNTIEGGDSGGIGGAHFNFINGAKGIVAANSASGPFQIDALSFQNSGLMEASDTGSLNVLSDISQTGAGKMEAADAVIGLAANTGIVGGAVSIGINGILSGGGGSFVDPTTAIANAGTVEQDNGGTLFIDGSVTNAATGALEVSNNSSIDISGTVTKGTAEISDLGSITLGGPSSANVEFGSGVAELVLDDATKFTGSVSGMAANPQAFIDLENIPFADDPTVSFANGLLTVADPTTKITDKIKISGTAGTFAAMENLSDGSTVIHDPPSASQGANIPLPTNYAASSFAGAAHGDVATAIAPDASPASPTTTTWKNGMTGDFNIAANWTNGVPAAGDTALITASGTYTVTSSQNNTLSTLDMASGATLEIGAGTFALTLNSGAGALGGKILTDPGSTLQLGTNLGASTLNNTGAITVKGGSGLIVQGLITLLGTGSIDVEDIIEGETSPATLINSSNTIESSSGGTIGGPSGVNLNFINGTKGVVESEGFGGGLGIETVSFQNSGLVEASANSDINLFSNISQTTTGRIECLGGIELSADTGIIGGAVTVASGGFLQGGGGSFVEPAKAIANAGSILQTSSGTLFIDGSVTNAATGVLKATGNGSINISGTVTKGTAEISDVGSITFGGPSSANVEFGSGVAELVLDDATKFTGSVSGMAGNSQAFIDLENISFADGFTIAFAKGVLTVTDVATKVADKIKISGTAGTFVGTENLSDGSVVIHDPPAAAQSANIALLANYVASSFAGTAHGDGPIATGAGSRGSSHELSLALPHGS